MERHEGQALGQALLVAWPLALAGCADRLHRELGISKWDPWHLYQAYHEGIGGYRSGHWRHDRHLLQTACHRPPRSVAALQVAELLIRLGEWPRPGY